MKIAFVENPWEKRADALVLPVAAKEKRFPQALGKKNGDYARSLFQSKTFEGKEGEVAVFPSLDARPFTHVVLAGLGEAKQIGAEAVRRGVAAAVATARQKKWRCLVVAEGPKGGMNWPAAAEAAVLADYSFSYATEKREESGLRDLFLGVRPATAQRRLVEVSRVMAEATCFARDLANEPANVATPTYLAEQAKAISKRSSSIKVRVFHRAKLKEMGMNALLAVAQGSQEEPCLIVLEHRARQRGPWHAIVGKGITFDSGGISIKPSRAMDEMKYDMSGAAAVLGTFHALAKHPLPINVVGIAACTENLPSGTAQRPGDIIRSYSGKTIEVLNTDAEGRLVLADALAYAEKTYNPKAMVDLATLTGACVVALGHHAAGVLGTSEDLIEKLRRAGEETGERLWPLPLWAEYEKEVKSRIADVKNISERGAGTVAGAAFLKAFVARTPWAHLDIAGTAWDMRGYPYIPRGATGFGVRLLYRWLQGEAGV